MTFPAKISISYYLVILKHFWRGGLECPVGLRMRGGFQTLRGLEWKGPDGWLCCWWRWRSEIVRLPSKPHLPEELLWATILGWVSVSWQCPILMRQGSFLVTPCHKQVMLMLCFPEQTFLGTTLSQQSARRELPGVLIAPAPLCAPTVTLPP